ncbi:hypothetical protein [Burkholderia phage BCSR5]|nr:hypothetical protein [Burkholderia phage BCSR5]
MSEVERKVGYWAPTWEPRYEFEKKIYAGLSMPVPADGYLGSEEHRRFCKLLGMMEMEVYKYALAHLENRNYRLQQMMERPSHAQMAISEDTPKAEIHQYRGSSDCRCCRQRNGSREYVFRFEGIKWVWPEGYRHYIEEHGVEPDASFRLMIYAYFGITP